jgi:hypothetical protein
LRNLICLVLIALCAAAAPAAEWKRLEGTAAITADNYLDPAAGEAKDSHWRVQLRGTPARELFEAMKGPGTKDECTGGTLRRAGAMRCVRLASPRRYECDFSIDLRRQTIGYGVAC